MQGVIHPERLAFFSQLLHCIVPVADHKAFRKIYPMCFNGVDAIDKMLEVPDFACYSREEAVRLCQELLRRRYFVKARPIVGFSLSEVVSAKEALKETFNEKELYQFTSFMYLNARSENAAKNLVQPNNPQPSDFNTDPSVQYKRGSTHMDFDDEFGGRDELLRGHVDGSLYHSPETPEPSALGSRSQRRGSTSVFIPPAGGYKHASELLDVDHSNDPYSGHQPTNSYSSRQHYQQQQAVQHQLQAQEPVPIYVGLEGVLEKRRKKKFQMAMFQQRFFKLDVKAKCITYSASSDSPFPLGYVLLSDIVEVRKWPDKKGRLDVISTERIYVLRAETDDIAVKWVKGVNAARKDLLNQSGWFRKRPELPSLGTTIVPTIFTFAFEHGLQTNKQVSQSTTTPATRPTSAHPLNSSSTVDPNNNSNSIEQSTTVNPNERRRSISSVAQPSTTSGSLFKKSANYMSKVHANERRLQSEQRIQERRATKPDSIQGTNDNTSPLAPTAEEDEDNKIFIPEGISLSRSPSTNTNTPQIPELSTTLSPLTKLLDPAPSSSSSPQFPAISPEELELYSRQAYAPLPFGRLNLNGKFILLSGYRNAKVYQLNLSILRIQFYQITFSLTSLEHHNYLSLLLERFATDEQIIQYLYELILLPSESTEDLHDLSYLRYSFLDKDKYNLQSLQYNQYHQQHSQLYNAELDVLKKSLVVEHFLLKPYQGRFGSAYDTGSKNDTKGNHSPFSLQQHPQGQQPNSSSQQSQFFDHLVSHMSSVPYLSRPDDPNPHDPNFLYRFCENKPITASSSISFTSNPEPTPSKETTILPTPLPQYRFVNMKLTQEQILDKQLKSLQHYQLQQSLLSEMLTPILTSISKNYSIPNIILSKTGATPQLQLPNYPQPINTFEFSLPAAPPSPLSYSGVTTLVDPTDGTPLYSSISPQPQPSAKLSGKQKFRDARASVVSDQRSGLPQPSNITALNDKDIFSDTANLNLQPAPSVRRIRHKRAMSDILIEISDKFYDLDGLWKPSPDFKFNLIFPDCTPAFRASIDCPTRLTYNCGNTPPGSGPEIYLRSSKGVNRRRSSEAGLSTLILTQPPVLTLMAHHQSLSGPKGIVADNAIAPPSVIPLAGQNSLRFSAPTQGKLSGKTGSLSSFHSSIEPNQIEKQKFPDFIQSDPLFTQERNIYSFITPRTQYNMYLQRYRVLYESIVKLNSFKSLPLRKRALMWLTSPSFPHALCSNFPSLGFRLALPFAWLWFQSLAHNSHYHSALVDDKLDRADHYLQFGNAVASNSYGVEYGLISQPTNQGMMAQATSSSYPSILANTTVLQLVCTIIPAQRVSQQPLHPNLLIQSQQVQDHIYNSMNVSPELVKDKAPPGTSPQRTFIAFQLIDWLLEHQYADNIRTATDIAKILYTYKIIVPYTPTTQASGLGSAHYHHYSTLATQSGNSTYVNGFQYDRSFWFIKTEEQLFGLLPLWQQYQVLVQHHVKILNHNLLSGFSFQAVANAPNRSSAFPTPMVASTPSNSSLPGRSLGQSGAFPAFPAASLMVMTASLDNSPLSDAHALAKQLQDEKHEKVRHSWFGNTSIAALLGNLSDDHWKFRTSNFCRACHKGSQNFLHLISFYCSEFCCAPPVSNLLHQPLGDWVRVYNYIPFTELRDQAIIHSLVTLLSQPIETILYHAQENCTDQFQYISRPIPNPTVWKPLVFKLYGASIFIRAKVLYNILFSLSGNHAATLTSQPGWCDWVLSLLDDVTTHVTNMRGRPWELYHDPTSQYVRYNGLQLPESIILPPEGVYLNVFHYSIAIVARGLADLYSNSLSTERLWPQFHQLVIPVSSVNHFQFAQDFNPHINLANSQVFLQATEYWNALSTTAAQLNVEQLKALQEYLELHSRQTNSPYVPFIQDPMTYQHVVRQAVDSGFGPLSSDQSKTQLTVSTILSQSDSYQQNHSMHQPGQSFAQVNQPQITLSIGAATLQQMQSQSGELLPLTLFPWYANRFNLPLVCIGIASALRPSCYRSQLKDAILSALSRSSPEDYLLPRQILDTQFAGLTNRAADKRSHRIHQHLPHLLYVLLLTRSFVFSLPLRLEKDDVGDCEAIQTQGQLHNFIDAIYSGPVFHSANVFDAHSQTGNTSAGYTAQAIALQHQVPKAQAIFYPNGPIQNHRENVYSLQSQLSLPPYAFVLGRHETGEMTKEQFTSNPAMFEYYEGRGLIWERSAVVGIQSMFDDKAINSSKYDDMWINLHWREPYGLDQDIELLDRALKLITMHKFVELESSGTSSSVLQQSISSLNAASINPLEKDLKDKKGGDEDENDNGTSGLILPDVNAVWTSFLILEPEPIKPTVYDLHAIRQIQQLAIFLKDAIAFLSLIREQILYLTPKQIHLVIKEFIKGGCRKKIFVHKFE